MASAVPNYISIYDNTASAHFIYVSESVTEVLGWSAEEMIGKDGYQHLHPDEIQSLKRVHTANVMNEKMSSMVAYRVRCKDGSYVMVETVVHYCFDVLVCTNFLYNPSDMGHKIRINSVDDAFIVNSDGSLQLVGAWNERQEHLREALSTSKNWINQRVAHKQEPRFCLILNRYTCEYTIAFISQMAEKLVGVQCDEVIGQSLFDYVSERDVDVVQAQLDLVKGSAMIVRLRFEWLLDPERDATEPVEAVVSSSNDGLVVVIRLTPRVTIA